MQLCRAYNKCFLSYLTEAPDGGGAGEEGGRRREGGDVLLD